MRALTRLGRRPSRSRRPRPLSRPVQRAPPGESHDSFITPRWKQAVGSTIHCLAGDATGIIAAAAITGSLALPLGVDLIIEYAAGFTFGLLIFQALFMKAMKGGSYLAAVRATILPEWLSMNALMAGMIPVMVVLTTQDPSAMEPTSGRFWGVMALATIVGGLLAYPVNWWLVATGLKHGMGSSRALGKGGHEPAQEPAVTGPTTSAKAAVAGITIVLLAIVMRARRDGRRPVDARRRVSRRPMPARPRPNPDAHASLRSGVAVARASSTGPELAAGRRRRLVASSKRLPWTRSF